MNDFRLLLLFVVIALTTGCVSLPDPHDYSEFRNSNPHSILILPPINNSTEVIAPYSVLSQVSVPISESGYYVYPTALVDMTFKSNGLTVAEDVHNVPLTKLREIFGADAALYITIEEYGTSYVVISSDTVVRLTAKLIDLRSGKLLWQDTASASSSETRGNSGGGFAGMLVSALVHQIMETVVDAGFNITAITSNRLLFSGGHNGLLHGPRSPMYGQPATSEKK